MGKYLWGGALTGVCIAAMVCSAGRPGEGVAHAWTVWTYDTTGDVASWYQRGPLDGVPQWEEQARALYDADAANGAAQMLHYGCGACHIIPGVTGADGTVGPSLDGFANRAYVAGVLPNQPAGLVRWLVNPTVHSPQTAMPDLDIDEDLARDMAAYLYTLGGG